MIRDNEETPCRLHSFVFHPGLVYGEASSAYYQKYMVPLLLEYKIDKVVFSIADKNHEKVYELIGEMWGLMEQEEDGYEFEIRHLMSELLYRYVLPVNRIMKPLLNREQTAQMRLRNMLQYINENFEKDISVENIADHAGVSESTCLRCFKSILGISPIRYLVQYRLTAAYQLLEFNH